MAQDFTFVDPGGNQAQYTVYDADSRNEFHWSTDHGDRGYEHSYRAAQEQARNALKASMTVRRRAPQSYR
jgi:hypothetical protein